MTQSRLSRSLSTKITQTPMHPRLACKDLGLRLRLSQTPIHTSTHHTSSSNPCDISYHPGTQTQDNFTHFRPPACLKYCSLNDIHTSGHTKYKRSRHIVCIITQAWKQWHCSPPNTSIHVTCITHGSGADNDHRLPYYSDIHIHISPDNQHTSHSRFWSWQPPLVCTATLDFVTRYCAISSPDWEL